MPRSATGFGRKTCPIALDAALAAGFAAAGCAAIAHRATASNSKTPLDRLISQSVATVRSVVPTTCRLTLVSPPVALALDILAASIAETGRADDEDLEPLRTRLVAAPRAGRDAHRVPLLQVDDLVVELHPPAPAHDHVHLFLRRVRVAVRKAIAGRDALVAQAGLLELERISRQAELQIRRAVEVG